MLVRLRLWVAIFSVVLAGTIPAHAQVRIIQDVNLGGTGGTKIPDTALIAAGTWTGWIQVSSMATATFSFNYTDGAGGAGTATITQVSMRCESDWVATTANDAGEDMHGLGLVVTATAATLTSSPLRWNNGLALAGDNSERWTWTVENIPAPFINCLIFAGTVVSVEADDTIVVRVRGATP